MCDKVHKQHLVAGVGLLLISAQFADVLGGFGTKCHGVGCLGKIREHVGDPNTRLPQEGGLVQVWESEWSWWKGFPELKIQI